MKNKQELPNVYLSTKPGAVQNPARASAVPDGNLAPTEQYEHERNARRDRGSRSSSDVLAVAASAAAEGRAASTWDTCTPRVGDVRFTPWTARGWPGTASATARRSWFYPT